MSLDITNKDPEDVIGFWADEWADALPRIRRWLRSLGSKVPAEVDNEL